MALRVQGSSSAARLAAAMGTSGEDAAAQTADAVASGEAAERSGQVTLTDDGEAALRRLLEASPARSDPDLAASYERFLLVDEEVRRAATDWQVRRYGGAEMPNDHKDPEYDQSVIDRLRAVHDRASALIRQMEARLPRLAPYRTRLAGCIDRLLAGDRAAFTAVIQDSYHTVWFQLHQDLLLTLGRPR